MTLLEELKSCIKAQEDLAKEISRNAAVVNFLVYMIEKEDGKEVVDAQP